MRRNKINHSYISSILYQQECSLFFLEQTYQKGLESKFLNFVALNLKVRKKSMCKQILGDLQILTCLEVYFDFLNNLIILFVRQAPISHPSPSIYKSAQHERLFSIVAVGPWKAQVENKTHSFSSGLYQLTHISNFCKSLNILTLVCIGFSLPVFRSLLKATFTQSTNLS